MHEHTYPTTPRPARSMKLADAAALLQVSDRHLRRLAADGSLRVYRVGRAIRVTETALAEFQQRQGA